MTDKNGTTSDLLLTNLENPHKVKDLPENNAPPAVMGANTSAKPMKPLTETTQVEEQRKEQQQKTEVPPITLPNIQPKTEKNNDIPVSNSKSLFDRIASKSKKTPSVSSSSTVKSRSRKYKKPSMSKSEVHQKKVDLLYKFADLRSKGIKMSKNYTLDSDLEDMQYEFDKLNKQKKIQNSIVLQQNLLISGISFIEMMNDKYDPFGLKLKGWSENIHDNIDQYNGVFEELYEKYKTSIEAPPEVKLLGMLAGSACMYHLSQSLSDNIQNLSAMNMQEAMRPPPPQPTAAAPQQAPPPQDNLQDLLSNLGKMQGNNQPIPTFNVDSDSEKDSNEGDGELNFN